MSAVETTADVEVLEQLDFDAEVACELILLTGDRCGSKAAWVVRARCCGFSLLWCEGHRVKWLTAAQVWGSATCGRCFHHEDAFLDLVEIIPIGGAS